MRVPDYSGERWRLYVGDCLETMRGMEAGSVQTCVTSPPYFGLRDYGGGDSEIGKEATPAEFVAALVAVFREVRRILADDGTAWVNLGDSYAGSNMTGGNKSINSGSTHDVAPKNLLGIPWRVAFALQEDGWYLRQDIIWAKPNPMPESVTDRCTKAHEYVFLLSKNERYFYDAVAVAEPASDEEYRTRGKVRPGVQSHFAEDAVKGRTKAGLSSQAGGRETRNRRSVWSISSQPFPGSHFAVMPPALVDPCILAGSRPGDVVFDPFAGSGTVGEVALRLGRRFVGCELNPKYAGDIAARRIGSAPLPLDFDAPEQPAPTPKDSTAQMGMEL